MTGKKNNVQEIESQCFFRWDQTVPSQDQRADPAENVCVHPERGNPSVMAPTVNGYRGNRLADRSSVGTQRGGDEESPPSQEKQELWPVEHLSLRHRRVKMSRSKEGKDDTSSLS